MPRYIDADKLIELATHEGAYGYVDVHDICNVPTADVVEIVRCKDCKWYSAYIGCDRLTGLVGANEDSYCSRGERKEKTDE